MRILHLQEKIHDPGSLHKLTEDQYKIANVRLEKDITLQQTLTINTIRKSNVNQNGFHDNNYKCIKIDYRRSLM